MMLNCFLNNIINARRMREGYCSHPVCLCVCVSVTALALTYDACATKLDTSVFFAARKRF